MCRNRSRMASIRRTVEIPIPLPSSKKMVDVIIKVVDDLERKVFVLATTDEVQQMEGQLQKTVEQALASS